MLLKSGANVNAATEVRSSRTLQVVFDIHVINYCLLKMYTLDVVLFVLNKSKDL